MKDLKVSYCEQEDYLVSYLPPFRDRLGIESIPTSFFYPFMVLNIRNLTILLPPDPRNQANLPIVQTN